MSDASGASFWNYDIMGHMTQEKRTVIPPGGAPITESTYYSYHYNGTVASLTYPSGRKLNFQYNNLGWNTQISKTDFFGSGQVLYYVNNASYMPDGQLAEVNIGKTSGNCFGGIWGEFSYNLRLQPLKVIYTTDTPDLGDVTDAGGWCSTSSGEFFNKRYQFGKYQGSGVYPQYNNGTLGAINNCLNGGLHLYTYDDENRINWAQSVYGGDDYTENYSLDPWGNLTGISGSRSEWLSVSANSANQISGNQYDPAGNVTSDGINNYTYDPENRISVVSNGEAAWLRLPAFSPAGARRTTFSNDRRQWTTSDRAAGQAVPENAGSPVAGRELRGRGRLLPGPSTSVLRQCKSAQPRAGDSPTACPFRGE
jgi:hypothetical protein